MIGAKGAVRLPMILVLPPLPLLQSLPCDTPPFPFADTSLLRAAPRMADCSRARLNSRFEEVGVKMRMHTDLAGAPPPLNNECNNVYVC